MTALNRTLILNSIINNDNNAFDKLILRYKKNLDIIIIRQTISSKNSYALSYFIDNKLITNQVMIHLYQMAFKLNQITGEEDIIKLFIKNKNHDIEKFDNYFIRKVNIGLDNFFLVRMVWDNNEKVRQTLKHDDVELYNLLIQKDIKHKVERF
jgi:hypothetical protein